MWKLQRLRKVRVCIIVRIMVCTRGLIRFNLNFASFSGTSLATFVRSQKRNVESDGSNALLKNRDTGKDTLYSVSGWKIGDN